MNFIKRFYKGMIDFDAYPQLTSFGIPKGICNVLIVSVISLILLLIPFSLDYLRLGGITGAINKYVPDFSIKDGILTTDKYYNKEIEELSVIIIDTKGKYTEQDLLKYESGIIITSDKLYLKDLLGDCKVQSYADYEKAGITDKKALLKFVPIVRVYIVIIAAAFLVFLFIQNMFFTIIFAMIANIAAFIFKKKLAFMDSLAIACYAMALPTIVKYLITAANQLVTTNYPFSMPLEIYVGLVGVYCFLAVKGFKKENNIKTA